MFQTDFKIKFEIGLKEKKEIYFLLLPLMEFGPKAQILPRLFLLLLGPRRAGAAAQLFPPRPATPSLLPLTERARALSHRQVGPTGQPRLPPRDGAGVCPS